MSASPLDPMVHMLTTLALKIGAAARVTVSAQVPRAAPDVDAAGRAARAALVALRPGGRLHRRDERLRDRPGVRWHHDDPCAAPTVRPRPSRPARRHARAAACAAELDRPPWHGGRPRRRAPTSPIP